MVNGLELFLSRFQGLEDCFILIGGTACDLWMTDKGLSFRATKDLDIVLVAEALRPEFFERFWAFIRDGALREPSAERHPPEFLSVQEAGKYGASLYAGTVHPQLPQRPRRLAPDSNTGGRGHFESFGHPAFRAILPFPCGLAYDHFRRSHDPR